MILCVLLYVCASDLKRVKVMLTVEMIHLPLNIFLFILFSDIFSYNFTYVYHIYIFSYNLFSPGDVHC